jgi:hypothetical protein
VKNPKYKGSSYNLLIEWDSEKPTWEPLNIIAADNKVTCASKANNMLNVKHNGRLQAWFVAGGHMTCADGTNSYSSVVLLRTLQLAILLGELNSLNIMIRDIMSAYLMAFTKEKSSSRQDLNWSEIWSLDGCQQVSVWTQIEWEILALLVARHIE